MDAEDLDAAIRQSHAALQAIIKGDPNGFKAFLSRAEDVTLGNPFGPFVKGWARVEPTVEAAARNYRDGEVSGVDLIARYESGGLACIVEVESGHAKIGGGAEFSRFSLRVTSVYRLEHDVWRLVHRHADPITAPRPATSVISA
jgi:hypothetical protein